jgi:hypothetical protein
VERYRYRGDTIVTPWDPEPGNRRHRQLTSGKDTWSARCIERRTPGAGEGPRETTGGDTGTAPVGLPHRPCCFVPARTGRGRRQLICVLAQHCPSWFDDLWITDATPVPCGMSPETVKRSKPGRARRLRLLRVTLPVVLGPEAVPGVHGRRDAGHVVHGQPQDRGT